jgi:hypothetical protein
MTHGENERLVKKLATQALGLLATASGIATTLVLAIGNAPWAATAFAVELERGYHPARRSHLLVEDAGRVVIVSGAALATAYGTSRSPSSWRGSSPQTYPEARSDRPALPNRSLSGAREPQRERQPAPRAERRSGALARRALDRNRLRARARRRHAVTSFETATGTGFAACA